VHNEAPPHTAASATKNTDNTLAHQGASEKAETKHCSKKGRGQMQEQEVLNSALDALEHAPRSQQRNSRKTI